MFRSVEFPDESQKLKRKSPIERLPIVSIYKPDLLSKKIQMLDDLDYESESYPSGLGVNLTTNELGSRQTILQLATSRAAINSCHIGVSGWFNLDVIAARGTSRGIIFDSNPEVSILFDHTFKQILACPDRETFISRIKESLSLHDKDNAELSIDLKKYALRISPNFLFEDAFSPHEEIDRHAKTAGSWLENDSSYAYIRGLVLSQKIVVITEDITHHEVFQKIRCLLNDNGISIDTLYLSNVHDYIFSLENKLNFLKTFALLSDDNTWLIDSFAKALYLEQCITPCSELNAVDKQRLRWFPRVSFPSPLESPPMMKASVKEPQNSLKLMMALSWIMVTFMLYLSNQSQVSSKPQLKF